MELSLMMNKDKIESSTSYTILYLDTVEALMGQRNKKRLIIPLKQLQENMRVCLLVVIIIMGQKQTPTKLGDLQEIQHISGWFTI